MMAIRDNPVAARSMGINVPFYRAVTFGVSGLYTGIAGALGAIVVQFVAPDSFTIYLSVAFLVGLVVGGVGWLPGAFFGAAFILFVPNIAEHFSKGLSGAVYGLMLIVLMLVMPSGFAGAVRIVSPFLKKPSVYPRDRSAEIPPVEGSAPRFGSGPSPEPSLRCESRQSQRCLDSLREEEWRWGSCAT